jgi:hypothetical protein
MASLLIGTVVEGVLVGADLDPRPAVVFRPALGTLPHAFEPRRCGVRELLEKAVGLPTLQEGLVYALNDPPEAIRYLRRCVTHLPVQFNSAADSP